MLNGAMEHFVTLLQANINEASSEGDRQRLRPAIRILGSAATAWIRTVLSNRANVWFSYQNSLQIDHDRSSYLYRSMTPAAWN